MTSLPFIYSLIQHERLMNEGLTLENKRVMFNTLVKHVLKGSLVYQVLEL